MKTQKKKYGILIMTIMILFSSCSTQRAEPSESSSEPQIMRVEAEYRVESDLSRSDELDVQVRKESHIESVSEAESNIESSTVQSHSITPKTIDPTLSTKIETEIEIVTPVPTASPSPISEPKKSESAATPMPTITPTVDPTATPTAAVKPTETPTPSSTSKPVPTITPKPITESKVVWTIDVPGHYESVEVTKDIWVEEQGHWESGYWTSDWVYQCNQCGVQYPTVSEVNSHLDDSFDWDTMTGHSSYTQVSGELYWVETDPVWIVDVSGHYESVTVTEEVWIEEQGHWETITTE